MLFLEVILLSILSKMSNYLVKTSKFCLGSHLIGFSTIELCYKVWFQCSTQNCPNLLFFVFPTSLYSLCCHSFHSLSLLPYGLNTYQSSRLLILILCLLCFCSYPWVLCCVQSRLARIPRVQLTITISFTPSVRITYEWCEYTMNMLR